MATYEVCLEGVRIFGRHGFFDHETRDGNEFEVTLTVNFEEPPEQSRNTERTNTSEESLEGTVSYVDLFEIVKEEMAIPRKLLETVARTIVQRVRQRFPFVDGIDCRITKLSPPIAGFIGSASVTYRI